MVVLEMDRVRQCCRRRVWSHSDLPFGMLVGVCMPLKTAISVLISVSSGESVCASVVLFSKKMS